MRPVNKLLLLLIFLQSFSVFSQPPDLQVLTDRLTNATEAERLRLIQQYNNQLSPDTFASAVQGLVELTEKNGWLPSQALLEKELGTYYYWKGDYENTLPHYLASLKLYEQLGDLSNQGQIYHLLATFSKKQKAYQKTNQYLDQALAVCQQAGDSVCISTVYDNRGLVYAEQGDYEKAEQQYLKTLDLRKRLDDTLGLGYVYSNLAEVASHKGFYEQAVEYINISNQYKMLMRDTYGLAINLTNMAEVYFNKKDFQNAAQMFEASLQYSVATGFTDLSKWNYEFASRAYAEMGDTERALAYLNRSYVLKDSLLTAEKLRQITEMETRFETAQKEQQIQLQKLEIENQQQHIFNQRILGAGIMLALLVLGLWAFTSYRNRQQIQLRQEQLSYQKRLLSNTIEVQEQERQRIARDLHDGIGQQLSGLKMAWQQLSAKLPDQQSVEAQQLQQMETILHDTATEVRSISHQMMPKALEAFGLVTSIEGLLEKTLPGISYDFEHHGMQGRLAQNIELSVYRILQELLNNILKHADATEVNVELFLNQQQLLLMVEDNGKGFDTHKNFASGHGMMNVNSRAQAVNGNIHFESKPGDGTLATLTIPIA